MQYCHERKENPIAMRKTRNINPTAKLIRTHRRRRRRKNKCQHNVECGQLASMLIPIECVLIVLLFMISAKLAKIDSKF